MAKQTFSSVLYGGKRFWQPVLCLEGSTSRSRCLNCRFKPGAVCFLLGDFMHEVVPITLIITWFLWGKKWSLLTESRSLHNYTNGVRHRYRQSLLWNDLTGTKEMFLNKTNKQPKSEGKGISSLAEYIKSEKCKKVVFMVCRSFACSFCSRVCWLYDN